MSFAEQLTRLQAFLDADELHEEALDYVAAHGYLTALSICSEAVPEREWIDALFAEPPHYRSDEERQEIETSLEQLKAHITRVLASDEDLELPCDLDLGDEPDDGSAATPPPTGSPARTVLVPNGSRTMARAP